MTGVPSSDLCLLYPMVNRARLPARRLRWRLIKPNYRRRCTINQNVERKKIAGKGYGVVAKLNLPETCLVGAISGRLWTEGRWNQSKRAGLITGKYGMDFHPCNKRRNGINRSKVYVIDPEIPKRTANPKSRKANKVAFYRGTHSSLGHLINEPSGNEACNATFVWKIHPRSKMPQIEIWTIRPVPKGGEILVYYGDSYGPFRAAAGYKIPPGLRIPAVYHILGARGTLRWDPDTPGGWLDTNGKPF